MAKILHQAPAVKVYHRQSGGKQSGQISVETFAIIHRLLLFLIPLFIALAGYRTCKERFIYFLALGQLSPYAFGVSYRTSPSSNLHVANASANACGTAQAKFEKNFMGCFLLILLRCLPDNPRNNPLRSEVHAFLHIDRFVMTVFRHQFYFLAFNP